MESSLCFWWTDTLMCADVVILEFRVPALITLFSNRRVAIDYTDVAQMNANQLEHQRLVSKGPSAGGGTWSK